MGGVIDSDGTQWERCNRCCKFVEISTLHYEQPSEAFQYGRDLCFDCEMQMRLFNAPATLPRDQWKDQLSPERKEEIRREVTENIRFYGLKVFVHNADGTVTDESIPPESER